MVLLGHAGDLVGAAHGVVQAAGQLERHLEAGAVARKPASSASSGQGQVGVGPVRNFATTRQPSRERAVRMSATATAWSSPARHLEGERQLVEAELAPARVPGRARRRRPARGLVAQRVDGRRSAAPGRRPGRATSTTSRGSRCAAVAASAAAPASRGVEHGARGRPPRGGHEQRPDAAGVRGAAVPGVPAHGVGQRGVAGREDGRVVDQAASSTGCRRRHARQPIARCPPGQRPVPAAAAGLDR